MVGVAQRTLYLRKGGWLGSRLFWLLCDKMLLNFIRSPCFLNPASQINMHTVGSHNAKQVENEVLYNLVY